MNNKFLSKVFGWLFVGLILTFATGYLVATTEELLYFIFSSNLGYWFIIIAEFAIAVYLSARIHSMRPTTAKVLYALYAILTGTTFASVFIIFDMASIIFIFLVAAITFGIFALIGNFTKVDLSRFSTMFFMGLTGTILISILDVFLTNINLNVPLCVVGLIIFYGYTAYDMQKIKRLTNANDNLAIFGAFELYLDFINIFLKLLSLFGKERNN